MVTQNLESAKWTKFLMLNAFYGKYSCKGNETKMISNKEDAKAYSDEVFNFVVTNTQRNELDLAQEYVDNGDADLVPDDLLERLLKSGSDVY